MKEKSRRTEIIETAARMFRQKGFSATSTRDIARGLGMQSPSLYNHISSKQEILNELLLPLAEKYCRGIQDIFSAPLDPRAQLEKVIAEQIRITIDHTDAVALIPQEWVHLEGSHKEQFLHLREEYEKAFQQILRNGIAQGYFQPVNVEIATFSILSPLRFLHSWYRKNDHINPHVLEQELITQLVGGLEKK